MKQLFILLILIAALSAQGTNRYVATNGVNSTERGTEALPYLTIAYAYAAAVPGDVIIVEDGTYTAGTENFGYLTTSGTGSAYITIKARNKGMAVLDGQNNTTVYAFPVHASYLNIEGFEIRNCRDNAFTISGGVHHLNFRDLIIHDIGRQCSDIDVGYGPFYMNGSHHITIERCLIYDIGRFGPGEHGCSPSELYWQGLDHAVYVDGCSDVVIRNNVFYNILHGYSLQVYSGAGLVSDSITFVNNTCENGNPNQYMAHVILAGDLNHALIANNIFKDQYDTGIRVSTNVNYPMTDVLITKNMIAGGNGTAVSGSRSGVTITGNYENTDPLFVDEDNHNYALQGNSPAINTGYNTGVITDCLNNARSTEDIGAYEYISGRQYSTSNPDLRLSRRNKPIVRRGRLISHY